MSVSVPPSMPKKLTGSSNREACIFRRRAMSTTSGMATATAAVLLMKADTPPTRPAMIRIMRNSEFPISGKRRLPSTWINPERCMPADRMNMASTVTVAVLDRPDKPSRTVGKADCRSTPRSSSHCE